MDNAEFNRLVHVASNGGSQIVGGEASALLSLLRRKAAYFLVSRGRNPDSTLLDDLADAVFVDLLQTKGVPERYAWGMWVRFRLRRAWSTYCKTHLTPEVSLEDVSPDADWADRTTPVPADVHAKMLSEDGTKILRARLEKGAPAEDPGRTVWWWAVDLLLGTGAVLLPATAARRFRVSEASVRPVILSAIIGVRLAFEELFGDAGLHTSAECTAADAIAQSIF